LEVSVIQKSPVLSRVEYILGILFIFAASPIDNTYALIAGTIGNQLKHNSWFLRSQRYVTSGIYISLGMATAFSGSSDR
jgi:threonine/homoserine/homoserine lactone efflux protein